MAGDEAQDQRADLEEDIAAYEDMRADAKYRHDKAQRGASSGVVGLLAGLVFLFLLPPLGVFLLLAGVLALLTGWSKKNSAAAAMREAEYQIATLRAELAELRTQMLENQIGQQPTT